jgi:hypothetical protein
MRAVLDPSPLLRRPRRRVGWVLAPMPCSADRRSTSYGDPRKIHQCLPRRRVQQPHRSTSRSSAPARPDSWLRSPQDAPRRRRRSDGGSSPSTARSRSARRSSSPAEDVATSRTSRSRSATTTARRRRRSGRCCVASRSRTRSPSSGSSASHSSARRPASSFRSPTTPTSSSTRCFEPRGRRASSCATPAA